MHWREILERLIGFETVSDRPNIALMLYVRGLLAEVGVAAVLIPDVPVARPIFMLQWGRQATG